MRPFLPDWMPVIAWMALILLGSTDVLAAENTSRFLAPVLRWLDPGIAWAVIDMIHTVMRKLGHVTEYAILAILLRPALGGSKTFKRRIWILFALVWCACAIFAGSDEFHQSFISSRMPLVHDVMIDTCGALVGLAICWLFAGRRSIEFEITPAKH